MKITWDALKKWLYKQNRVDELCNKNTPCETITLWNGLMVMKYDSQKKYKMIIYRSGQARYILQKYTIKKAVGMFDWPIIGEKIVGKELPPTKFRKKPLIVYLDPKDYKIL